MLENIELAGTYLEQNMDKFNNMYGSKKYRLKKKSKKSKSKKNKKNKKTK